MLHSKMLVSLITFNPSPVTIGSISRVNNWDDHTLWLQKKKKNSSKEVNGLRDELYSNGNHFQSSWLKQTLHVGNLFTLQVLT